MRGDDAFFGRGPRVAAVIAAGLAGVFASDADADFTDLVAVSYTVDAVDFGGDLVSVHVQDLYLESDDADDILLNVYDLQWNDAVSGVDFYHSPAGTGWQPVNLGGPFDSQALRVADSFVTIGGVAANAEQAPGAGPGLGLDPNFGGNAIASPATGAGWYNASPPNLAGGVTAYHSGVTGVFIGRFSSTTTFDLEGTQLSTTWNQGLGTDGHQRSFTLERTLAPAPGAALLLALAGLTAARRPRETAARTGS